MSSEGYVADRAGARKIRVHQIRVCKSTSGHGADITLGLASIGWSCSPYVSLPPQKFVVRTASGTLINTLIVSPCPRPAKQSTFKAMLNLHTILCIDTMYRSYAQPKAMLNLRENYPP